MSQINVELGDRSYPIFIGSGIAHDPENYRSFIASSQVLLVTNTTIDPIYSKTIESALSFVETLDKVLLPDGEQYKNLNTLNAIFDGLLKKGHNRKTTLIALGGGVIGDMVGFAAASYQRGVNFIQIPTTLLSQVDSSVGGKTGVNHILGKNMIGAFHQPKSVVIDTDMLKTLPSRELSAGLAEVIKYGLIADQEFFSWLEQNIEKLVAVDGEALAHAIERSCQIKADVVAQDEKEGGIRAILNFGHTFGHAIEAHQGYGVWLHGEAVGAGMIMACKMSAKLGWLDESIVERAIALITKAGLPILPPEDMTPETFLKYMSVDKKVLDKTLRLILLKACGDATVTSDFSDEVLHEILQGV
ncbi:3-dehydroquinate synthase [Agarilytica rhodophyticola]|uniref:3-dehydroquinate synthase n=1 Tax=Agarilytica rhodophyticola TaxID=1737490 RepID=UPI000B341FBA|nr:3-dehydroquinate synthase [Agarilytica rhodophyticola]